MKKLIIALVCMASAGFLHAEDAIQVVPFETKAGANVDDAKYFSIAMNNASAEIWALQFDLLLPEGMKIDNESGYDPFELIKERFPHTTGRGGAITWKHTVYYDLLESGWYRIIVFTSEAERIIGNSGELLNIYYLTDENMQPGLHPIYIKGAVLTITGDSDIKPMESTSYCRIGESPLKSEGKVDLKDFTGHIPSWVVESMNTDLASNMATEVHLENADALGAALETANKNTLYYVKAGSEAAQQLDGKSVVETDGISSSCENLYLFDGEYPFSNSSAITGKKAHFDRTFIKEYWSTVCLPFDVSEEQVLQLKSEGVRIEQPTSYSGNSLMFSEVDAMVANTPYIVKCNSEQTPFGELEITSIASTENVNDVVLDQIQFKGCYETAILNSDETTAYYVFNSATGEFVKVGRNGKVPPFRAYIELRSDSAPAGIRVRHGNEETGIDSVWNNDKKCSDIYNVCGHLVKKELGSSKTDIKLEKGIYIINNRKVIIK